MNRLAIVALAAGVLAALVPAGRAALFHPEEPFAIPMNEKGQPDLSFDTFASRRADLMNAANPAAALDDPKAGRTFRGRTKDRIERLQRRANRTEWESVTLAVDLLRVGRVNEAEEPLRNFRRGYVPNITLAHVAAVQGEWTRAYTLLDIALTDEPPPKAVPGLTAQQLAWQLKIDRGPLKKLFHLRLAESRGPKRAVDDEQPDRIFDANFVNAAGAYEPGALVPAEAAKLPPDAIAIVQQLVLWFPHDVRLYWLLGEVYAAKGEFAPARTIMDQCVGSLTYSNRKALMQHREVVARAAEKKGTAPDEPLLAQPDAATPPKEETPPPVPFSFGAVGVYFGVVAAVALFALVRAVMKRRNANNGGPVG